MTTSLQHSRLLSFLTQVMNKKWHLTPEPVKIVNHRWWQTSQSIWTDDFILSALPFLLISIFPDMSRLDFPSKLGPNPSLASLRYPSVTTIPAPMFCYSLPFLSPSLNPSFCTSCQSLTIIIPSIPLISAIPSMIFPFLFIYLFILCCPIPQSCPISLPRLNATALPCFAFHSADAKSLRDPSKIKTMRLQVGQAFDLSRLLRDIWSF